MSFCTRSSTNSFLKSSFTTLTSSSDFLTLSPSTATLSPSTATLSPSTATSTSKSLSGFFTLLPGTSISHNLTFSSSAASFVKSFSLTLKYLSSFIYIALNAY